MKISVDTQEAIWAERYRPQTVDDLIFPATMKEKINEWIEKKSMPNIGIFGDIPGTGKSSLLNVLIKQLDTDTLWINGSKENGIDVMRNKIGTFASTMSMSGEHKLVCMDEADYLTVPAQSTLRSDMELFSKKTRFAFTGNYPEQIIEPLLKRLQIFDLDTIYAQNKKELGMQIFNRLIGILELEKVEYQKEDVLAVVKGYYPSTRDMIMHLEFNTVKGVLHQGGIQKADEVFEELVDVMRTRKFKDCRMAVEELLVPNAAWAFFWKNIDNIFELPSQPTVIMALSDYQDHAMRAANKHIPLGAFVTKMIGDPDVKIKGR